jgi:hypothetical protein
MQNMLKAARDRKDVLRGMPDWPRVADADSGASWPGDVLDNDQAKLVRHGPVRPSEVHVRPTRVCL